MSLPDGNARYNLPPAEIQRLVTGFIAQVSAFSQGFQSAAVSRAVNKTVQVSNQPHNGSATLDSMRRRISLALTFAASLGLALSLALADHGAVAFAAPCGMSAPPAPAPSVASGPSTQLLRSQFGWQVGSLRPLHFSLGLSVAGVLSSTWQRAATERSYYGPLYRRPPPGFSS